MARRTTRASLGDSDETGSTPDNALCMTRVASISFWSEIKFIADRMAFAKSTFMSLGP
jgi:hypothetical protein